MTPDPAAATPAAVETAPGAPGAPIPIRTLPNLRDLGGWPLPGGRVRHGLVYRSTELGLLSDDDLARVAALGLRVVIDLRTAGERDSAPDRLPPGARSIVADVLADSAGAAPAQLEQVVSNPDAAAAALGGGRAQELFTSAYRDVIDLPSARSAYRLLFTTLAESASRPTLFHCTTGKDRTGWAAASVLLLLGVDEADVRHDYLLTNEQLRPALQPLFDAFAAAGGDPELLEPVLGVRPEYIDAALTRMRDQFDGIDDYVVRGLGVDPGVPDRLRAALVELG
jgi:protein-tyrosine phosphatase